MIRIPASLYSIGEPRVEGNMETFRSEITDKDLASNALRAAGIEFRVRGRMVRLTSGDFAGTKIDLRTGAISTTLAQGKVGVLRQHYAEAKYRAECARQGIEVASRSVDANGDIVLMCRVT